jgi:hypothetical protein
LEFLGFRVDWPPFTVNSNRYRSYSLAFVRVFDELLKCYVSRGSADQNGLKH